MEAAWAHDDTVDLRKARGAFFTPPLLARHIVEWAVRTPFDVVYEPSAGDAAFLVEATTRLRALGADRPVLEGVELHPHSAAVGSARVAEAGGEPRIEVSDFFTVHPEPRFDAVVGNPPYVRYQEWTGHARTRSRQAALSAGVQLSGLASSWAAFTVQSALFLREGGRLGLVLPAELLSVNYAAPVRKFLFDSFSRVELVLFEKQVFEEAEANTLLLMASGFGEGPTDHAIVRQAYDANHLSIDAPGVAWTPADPSEKWVGSISDSRATDLLGERVGLGDMVPLSEWGDTTLGMVTGNNRYFALSPARVAELGLARTDIVRLSPPGSTHLRGLALTRDALTRLGSDGKSTRLFRPAGEPSNAAQSYIEAGRVAGVSEAYKCRVRRPWWRVPYLRPADLLLTYMNADAARIVTNAAEAHHLNSVHGVYLKDDLRELARDLLPIASINSATMLSAEMVGRSYGGGILKVEPREADRWLMPSREAIESNADDLRALRPTVTRLLGRGALVDAVELVDEVMLGRSMPLSDMMTIRTAHQSMQSRRMTRSKRG